MKRSPQELSFTKLEALGNDFMLVDGRDQDFRPDADLVRLLGDRRRGVGFDQLLTVERPQEGASACRVGIQNADGTRAEQCGNGMRAVALWLQRRGEIDGMAIIETDAGPVDVTIERSGEITAGLTVPDFSPAACGVAECERFPVELDADEETCSLLGVSLGNPHLILVMDEPPSHDDTLRLGRLLGTHERLAAGANIGLAHIADRRKIDLRVHERGAGATLACGSGACAAAVVLIERGKVDSPVEVLQPGGRLVINWAGQGSPVRMTGPARQVFQGIVEWPQTKNSPNHKSSNG